MRTRSIVLVSFIAALGAAGFAGAHVSAPLARPALGFVAKVVCSNVFLGGASPAQALADLPDEPIARLVRIDVDTAGRSVTASVPLVSRRVAHFGEGLGCTLDIDPPGQPSVPAIAPDSTAEWPAGERVESGAVAGIDRTRLDAAVAEAFAEPAADMSRDTRAIVIVHRGRIVAERYADGYDAASRFGGWSMTKSVTSALVGILVARGDLDIERDALLPRWRAASDARRAITLHHLLQMSSGLDFDESYTPTGGATRMLFDADTAAAVAARSPSADAPGRRWSYSSGTTNIISSLIRDAFASPADYHAFPRTALFDPIGMRSAVMETDPSGTFVGSSFMYATARDWARFGLLYLRDGVIDGRRILPEGWVRYSVTPAPAAPLGQYGAHWWLNAGAASDASRRIWPDLPRDIFWASGFEGQYVVIVPSHELVIVRLGVTPDERAFSLGALLRSVMAAVDAEDQTERRPGICPFERC